MFNQSQMVAVRMFAWHPKQVPLKKWNIVRGDQVSH